MSVLPTPADHADLKTLSTVHWIGAVLTAIIACFPLIHVGIGLAMLLSPESFDQPGKPPPPAWFGGIFVAIGGIIVLVGWAYAVALAVAARSLATARRHTFCVVVAGMACFNVPIGTVLGVWALSVLTRPGVKALFDPPPVRA